MLFESQDDVPDSFGPPGNSSLPNWAHTRYVPWSSWASASTIWPNAGSGSSTQGESSGLGTYAHELTHLLGIGDNYNNPFATQQVRSYTGPWSMMSRGSFNGPGGPHTRWQVSLYVHNHIKWQIEAQVTDNQCIDPFAPRRIPGLPAHNGRQDAHQPRQQRQRAQDFS